MNIKSMLSQQLDRFGLLPTQQTAAASTSKIICKNFGEAEPVLDGHALFEYGYCPKWLDWYELLYDMLATAKLFRATSHHTSALIVKRNILTSDYIPHPLLSRHEFNALALNLLTFANCYVHVKRNRFDGIVGLGSRPALNMRRGLDLSSYYQLDWDQTNNHQFAPQDMIHVYESDIGQEVYGVPNYLSSINAILLNEAATLFRHRYYKNGAHAGFILHMTDALQTQSDVDDLEDSLENSNRSMKG